MHKWPTLCGSRLHFREKVIEERGCSSGLDLVAPKNYKINLDFEDVRLCEDY